MRPDGEQIGEIVVRGNTVMDGYYRDPDATSAAIRDGWLRTGDMATLDEAGYVLIKDRSKDVIIRGGENISSVEVENALAAHPAVLECAVVAAPDETFGEAPVALVVLKPGTDGQREGAQALLPRAPGALQGAARDPLPRRAAEGRDRQDPQGRAARAVLDRPRVARPLTRRVSAFRTGWPPAGCVARRRPTAGAVGARRARSPAARRAGACTTGTRRPRTRSA